MLRYAASLQTIRPSSVSQNLRNDASRSWNFGPHYSILVATFWLGDHLKVSGSQRSQECKDTWTGEQHFCFCECCMTCPISSLRWKHHRYGTCSQSLEVSEKKWKIFVSIFWAGTTGTVLAFMTRSEVTLKNTIIEQLRQRTTYVRASEVMSILGITRNTLCDWINAGLLPALRLGKNNMCDPAELAAFLEKRRTGV